MDQVKKEQEAVVAKLSAIDQELFDALQEPNATGWPRVADILKRGANPNARRSLRGPEVGVLRRFNLVNKCWDIVEAPRDEVGAFGDQTPLGALLGRAYQMACSGWASPDQENEDEGWESEAVISGAESQALLPLEELLAYGADPSPRFSIHNMSLNEGDGYWEILSPLETVIKLSWPLCCKRLLESGADSKQRTQMGVALLAEIGCEHAHESLTRRNLELVSAMIVCQADIDEPNQEGKTLLSQAASQFNFDLVDGLLKLGANPNARDRSESASALHRLQGNANRQQQPPELAPLLSEREEDVEVFRVAQRLLQAGADPQAKNGKGQTPEQAGHYSVGQAIRAFEAGKEREAMESAVPRGLGMAAGGSEGRL